MDSFEPDDAKTTNGEDSAQEALPPPPPVIPPNIFPVHAEPEQPPEPVKKKVVRVPIARRGLGSKGQKIPLLTNHFKVMVSNVDGHFFHYCVYFCHTPLSFCVFKKISVFQLIHYI